MLLFCKIVFLLGLRLSGSAHTGRAIVAGYCSVIALSLQSEHLLKGGVLSLEVKTMRGTDAARHLSRFI